LYSAAGDGYFESHDRGSTWQRPDAGLQHYYLWDVVVDPSDPDTVIVSAAQSARHAHGMGFAESVVYRKEARDHWHPVTGLPPADGTTISALAASSGQDAMFYAANNRGVYQSNNAGIQWERVQISWPVNYRSQRVRALAATGGTVKAKG
jgi:hypothetical protein